MAYLGYIALLLALVVALFSSIAYIWGARGKNGLLLKIARVGLLGVCGLVSGATAILLFSLLTHDFQIEYVASYTSRNTPLIYLLSSLWAGNDGSLLFWAWALSIFSSIAVLQRRGEGFVSFGAAVFMLIESFFLFLLLFLSNPFRLLPYPPSDGMGLNPLLENSAMIFHPPLLLSGYACFAIPFGFAIGALVEGRFGDDWLRAIRFWMLLAWLFLGLGNITGAWWAYVVLGWGGYWAWDPVENAGLMPWLLATASLHSIAIQRRRGVLKTWNILLLILTFSLTIFGTFLTRSGFISSIHAFAASELGPPFSAFLCISFLGSMGLLLYRRKALKDKEEISIASKEGMILLGSVLLLGIAFITLVGTVFPAISDAFLGTRIELGKNFFDRVNGPLFLSIVFFISICAAIGWRKILLRQLSRGLLPPLIATAMLGIALFILGIRQWYPLIGWLLCCFSLTTIIYAWFRDVGAFRLRKGCNHLRAFFGLFSSNKHHYGGYIVHIAVIIIAIGVIGSSAYQVERGVLLRPGDSMTVKNYILTYDAADLDIDEVRGRIGITAGFSVYREGRLIDTLAPRKYFYHNYNQLVTEVAIRSTIFEDLYLILGSWPGEDGSAFFIAQVNPLVIWIWIGGVVFLIGGVVALCPSRGKG